MTIITRSGKGSELSWAEGDANFVELDNRTKEAWQASFGLIDTTGILNPPDKELYKGMTFLNRYDPDNIQECSIVFHMPKDFVPGCDWYPHGHFTPTTNSVGTVRWGFSLIWANPYHAADFGRAPYADEIYGTPVTGYVEAAITSNMKDANMMMESPTPFSGTGLLPGCTIIMRVFRDSSHVNDTYPDGILLNNITILYRSNSFGTSTL